MKNPSCTRTLPVPVRPVGPCRIGHNASTGQTVWSDRLVPILAVNRGTTHGYCYQYLSLSRSNLRGSRCSAYSKPWPIAQAGQNPTEMPCKLNPTVYVTNRSPNQMLHHSHQGFRLINSCVPYLPTAGLPASRNPSARTLDYL